MKQNQHDKKRFEGQVYVCDHNGASHVLRLGFPNDLLQLVEESWHLQVPEDLEKIIVGIHLKRYQPWEAGHDVKHESRFEVGHEKIAEFIEDLTFPLFSCDEFRDNVTHHYDVNEKLKHLHLFHGCKVKCDDIWEGEERDHVENVGEHVPHLLVAGFCVDDVPLWRLRAFDWLY